VLKIVVRNYLTYLRTKDEYSPTNDLANYQLVNYEGKDFSNKKYILFYFYSGLASL